VRTTSTSVSTNDDYTAPRSAYGYTLDGFAKPDITAPGRYMVGPVPAASTLVTEKPASVVASGYIQLSGTSFAAPVVAGAAAQILSAHPTWTPDQVKGASDSQSAASWASASWSDNAEVEAPSEEGEYLSDAELAEFAADLGLVDPGAESGEPADTTTPPLP
jgi:subtilisin family serine protease